MRLIPHPMMFFAFMLSAGPCLAAPEIAVKPFSATSCSEAFEINFTANKTLDEHHAALYMRKKGSNYTVCGNFERTLPQDFDAKLWLRETQFLNYSQLSPLTVSGTLQEKLQNISQAMRHEFGLPKAETQSELQSVNKIWEKRLSSCHQLAAVYVAHARKLGIPARVVYGLQIPLLGVEQKIQELHAWVEVADLEKKTLIALEPLSDDAALFPDQLYIPFIADHLYDPLPEEKSAQYQTSLAQWVQIKGEISQKISQK